MTDPASSPRLDALIGTDREVRLGHFARTPVLINGADYDYRSPMGTPRPALARRQHYKQFQYFGVLADTVLAGCALAHTGWLGLAFVYVYDTTTGRLTSHTIRLPLGLGMDLSTSPVTGSSTLARGRDRIRLGYRELADGALEKTVLVDAGGIRMDAALIETTAFRPQALCTRTGINGWTFANKVAGVPVQGRLSAAGRDYDLAALAACGHHDFSAGYMRRETFWNWACLSGRAGGRLLGLNLSCGVNETSYSENCLWLDGQCLPVGLAQFDYDRRDPMQPWRVRSDDGAVDLTFRPVGAHTERMDLLLFATDFKQLFGRFDGTVRTDAGTIQIAGLSGFVEEQYAKW